MADISGDLNNGLFTLMATNLQNVLFVDPNGDNATAVKGDINSPWADPWSAGNSPQSQEGDIIIVFAGDYNDNQTGRFIITQENQTLFGFNVTLRNCAIPADFLLSKYKILGNINFVDCSAVCVSFTGGTDELYDIFIQIGSFETPNISDSSITVIEGDRGGNIIINIERCILGASAFAFRNDPDVPVNEELNVTYNIQEIENTQVDTNYFYALNAGSDRCNEFFNIEKVTWNIDGDVQSGFMNLISTNSVDRYFEFNINKLFVVRFSGTLPAIIVQNTAGTQFHNYIFNFKYAEFIDTQMFGASIGAGGQNCNYRFTGNYRFQGTPNPVSLNINAPNTLVEFVNFYAESEAEFHSDSLGNNLNTYRFSNSQIRVLNGGANVIDIQSNTATIEFFNSYFQNDGAAIAINSTVVRTVEVDQNSTSNSPALSPNVTFNRNTQF